MSRLSAVSLSKLKRDNILDEQVKMEIAEIDAKILNAHDDGLNIIAHNLPVKFMVNDGEQQDAKIYVYAELIKAYKDKGFIVKISLGKSPRIFCKWENRAVNGDMETRKTIIMNSLIQ